MKKQKGEYGYRSYYKKRALFIIGLLAAFILAQVAARYFVESKATKNILTVMAVLTVLPLANLASPLVAMWKYRTPSAEFHDFCKAKEDRCIMLYDLVVTTKDDVLPLDAAAIHPTGIYAYCTNPKADLVRARKAINEVLVSAHLDPNINITGERSAFEKRIKSLKPASEYEDDGSAEYAVQVLKGLSM